MAETQSHEGGSNQGFSGFQFRVLLSSSPESLGLFLLEKVQETLPTICEEVLFPQNKILVLVRVYKQQNRRTPWTCRVLSIMIYSLNIRA